MTELETERLRLCPFEAGDLAGLVSIYGDPEVMAIRKLGVLDADAAAAQLEAILEHWRAHGFGLWAVFERGREDFLGECGLRWTDDASEIELSYGLFPGYRGQGYATEAARAALAFGFDERKLVRIVAYSRGDNAVSHRVLEKCGMRRAWFRPTDPFGLVKYVIGRGGEA